MVFKTICFVLTIFGIAVTGHSRADVPKHAVKTITTEYGDIYDCIDFYKQPVFDHPVLKNHSFHPQMRPSFQPQRITNNVLLSDINATEIEITPLKDGGCPQGTVPIRRTEKKNFRLRVFDKSKSANDYLSGTAFAITQTKSSLSNVYNGIGAVITDYKPKVLKGQYSSAEITVKGGTDVIIAGWTVNPNKYSDDQTRFFIYAIAGDMHCFNSECGFVQVRSDIPLDILFKPVSERGKSTYVNKFFLYREPSTGSWWVQLGGIDGQREPVPLGFWPQNIFTGLKNSGTYVSCGGEVYSPATLPLPEMGSGFYPDAYIEDDAFCVEIVTVDDKNTVGYLTDVEVYTNNQVYGMKNQRTKHPFHRFHFGGPNPSDRFNERGLNPS